MIFPIYYLYLCGNYDINGITLLLAKMLQVVTFHVQSPYIPQMI